MSSNRHQRTFALLSIASALLVSPFGYGYEIDTHTELSLQAVRQSGFEGFLPSIGFSTLKDRVTDIGRVRSIEDWVGRGAADEDDTLSTNLARYRHHFFDAQHGGRGLVIATDTGEPSPDWALEDTRSFATQSYSFAEARQYFYDALTLQTD